MRVRVIYRTEPDGVWAESPDVPGYSAIGASIEEVSKLVAEGLPQFVGKKVELIESEASLVDDLFPRAVMFPTENPYESSFGPPSTGTPKLIPS